MKKKVYYGPDSVKAPLKWVLDFAMVMLFVSLWIVDQFDRLFLKKSNAGIKKAGNSSSRFFIYKCILLYYCFSKNLLYSLGVFFKKPG